MPRATLLSAAAVFLVLVAVAAAAGPHEAAGASAVPASLNAQERALLTRLRAAGGVEQVASDVASGARAVAPPVKGASPGQAPLMLAVVMSLAEKLAAEAERAQGEHVIPAVGDARDALRVLHRSGVWMRGNEKLVERVAVVALRVGVSGGCEMELALLHAHGVDGRTVGAPLRLALVRALSSEHTPTTSLPSEFAVAAVRAHKDALAAARTRLAAAAAAGHDGVVSALQHVLCAARQASSEQLARALATRGERLPTACVAAARELVDKTGDAAVLAGLAAMASLPRETAVWLASVHTKLPAGRAQLAVVRHVAASGDADALNTLVGALTAQQTPSRGALVRALQQAYMSRQYLGEAWPLAVAQAPAMAGHAWVLADMFADAAAAAAAGAGDVHPMQEAVLTGAALVPITDALVWLQAQVASSPPAPHVGAVLRAMAAHAQGNEAYASKVGALVAAHAPKDALDEAARSKLAASGVPAQSVPKDAAARAKVLMHAAKDAKALGVQSATLRDVLGALRSKAMPAGEALALVDAMRKVLDAVPDSGNAILNVPAGAWQVFGAACVAADKTVVGGQVVQLWWKVAGITPEEQHTLRGHLLTTLTAFARAGKVAEADARVEVMTVEHVGLPAFFRALLSTKQALPGAQEAARTALERWARAPRKSCANSPFKHALLLELVSFLTEDDLFHLVRASGMECKDATRFPTAQAYLDAYRAHEQGVWDVVLAALTDATRDAKWRAQVAKLVIAHKWMRMPPAVQDVLADYAEYEAPDVRLVADIRRTLPHASLPIRAELVAAAGDMSVDDMAAVLRDYRVRSILDNLFTQQGMPAAQLVQRAQLRALLAAPEVAFLAEDVQVALRTLNKLAGAKAGDSKLPAHWITKMNVGGTTDAEFIDMHTGVWGGGALALHFKGHTYDAVTGQRTDVSGKAPTVRKELFHTVDTLTGAMHGVESEANRLKHTFATRALRGTMESMVPEALQKSKPGDGKRLIVREEVVQLVAPVEDDVAGIAWLHDAADSTSPQHLLNALMKKGDKGSSVVATVTTTRFNDAGVFAAGTHGSVDTRWCSTHPRLGQPVVHEVLRRVATLDGAVSQRRWEVRHRNAAAEGEYDSQVFTEGSRDTVVRFTDKAKNGMFITYTATVARDARAAVHKMLLDEAKKSHKKGTAKDVAEKEKKGVAVAIDETQLPPEAQYVMKVWAPKTTFAAVDKLVRAEWARGRGKDEVVAFAKKLREDASFTAFAAAAQASSSIDVSLEMGVSLKGGARTDASIKFAARDKTAQQGGARIAVEYLHTGNDYVSMFAPGGDGATGKAATFWTIHSGKFARSYQVETDAKVPDVVASTLTKKKWVKDATLSDALNSGTLRDSLMATADVGSAKTLLASMATVAKEARSAATRATAFASKRAWVPANARRMRAHARIASTRALLSRKHTIKVASTNIRTSIAAMSALTSVMAMVDTMGLLAAWERRSTLGAEKVRAAAGGLAGSLGNMIGNAAKMLQGLPSLNGFVTRLGVYASVLGLVGIFLSSLTVLSSDQPLQKRLFAAAALTGGMINLVTGPVFARVVAFCLPRLVTSTLGASLAAFAPVLGPFGVLVSIGAMLVQVWLEIDAHLSATSLNTQQNVSTERTRQAVRTNVRHNLVRLELA